jgi:hypothetical protein
LGTALESQTVEQLPPNLPKGRLHHLYIDFIRTNVLNQAMFLPTQ